MMRTISALVLLVFCIAGRAEELSDLVIFSGSANTGFGLFVGDAGDWRKPIRNGSGESVEQRVTVAPSAQYDGMHLQ